ncbi:MATE family efflux transporter [Acetivibrio straminisolvens]|uniref:Multi antimicrobial extrusion protein n=1 Tax=Acetivibrio straminisolvens JCM 21531 TaxID=1294263 RepID=W4V6N8_9FIRM|nr:MATE family efflux transporter [Acetivibrio straminisolvens]GAE88862.1 multi antimicrobial extrusion protein [Acetivibrio straminisolvens JCM 21531]
MAAVGVVNQISYVLIMLYSVVSAGTTVLISQYLGAKKKKEASVVAVTSVAVSLLLGLCAGFVVYFSRRQMLMFLNIPSELMGYAMTFLGIVGGLSFTQAMIATLSAIIRSYGNTRITMYISIGMNILNIIGNSIFLYGLLGAPKMGVAGVAIATVISQAVGVVVMLIVMMTGSMQNFLSETLYRYRGRF